MPKGPKQPTKLIVTVSGPVKIEAPAGESANATAFKIMAEGIRHWDAENNVATFYPPHRILDVVARFGPPDPESE